MFLLTGLLAALHHARTCGKGQVVDAAMCDAASMLMTQFYGMRAQGKWSTKRKSNMLDGGAHYYATYMCSDGRYIAVGAIEPKFYELLRQAMGLDDPDFDFQHNPDYWPDLQKKISAIVRMKTQREWCEKFSGSDACISPVLSLNEAVAFPHLVQRNSFSGAAGLECPAPAPRFSATPSVMRERSLMTWEQAHSLWGEDERSSGLKT